MFSATNLLKMTLPNILCILETKPNHSIVFCGHSLGAGVAAVASTLLDNMFQASLLKLNRAPTVRAVTFAQPAACSKELALKHKHIVKAMIHSSDLVPRLSLANMGHWFQLVKVAMPEVTAYVAAQET